MPNRCVRDIMIVMVIAQWVCTHGVQEWLLHISYVLYVGIIYMICVTIEFKLFAIAMVTLKIVTHYSNYAIQWTTTVSTVGFRTKTCISSFTYSITYACSFSSWLMCRGSWIGIIEWNPGDPSGKSQIWNEWQSESPPCKWKGVVSLSRMQDREGQSSYGFNEKQWLFWEPKRKP